MLRRLTGFFLAGTTGQLVGILVGIVQARTLGPAGKSVIAYAIVGLSMALTATDGLSTAVLTQSGRDKRPLRVVQSALRRVALVLGVPMAVVLLIVAIAIPSQRPLIGAAIAIPFAIYVQGSQGVFLATGSARSLIVQGALTSVVVGLILIPLLLFAHISAYVALAVWVVAWIASAAYGLWACRSLDRDGAAAPEDEVRTATREQIRLGARNGLAMFAGYVNLRIDVFLVSAVLGARELGIYTLAVMTGELLWSWSQPVVWANLDRVAGLAISDAVSLVVRLTRNVFALQVVFALAFAAIGPPLIALVYGSSFAASGRVLLLLLPGMAMYAARHMMGYFILVRLERPMFLAISQTISAAACAAISLVLFPVYGIVGAAAATSVTYCALVLVQAVMFCRATQTPWTALVIPTGEDMTWFKRRLTDLVETRLRRKRFSKSDM